MERSKATATAVLDRWNALWLDPVDAAGMVVARTALGITLLYWSITQLPGVADFFGPDGLDPRPDQPWYHLSLLRILPAGVGGWLVSAVLVVAAVSLVIGTYARVFGLVAWACVFSMYHGDRLIWNGGDDLLRLLCLYIGLWCALTPRAVSELTVNGLRTARPITRGWGPRVVQIQIALVYASTVLEKLKGHTWLDGTATLRALGLSNMSRFPVGGVIRRNPIVGNLTAWGTVAVEVALPLLLFRRRTRRIAIALGVALHLTIEYSMRVGIFSWVMIVGYCAFLTRDDLKAAHGLWRRVRDGWGKAVPPPETENT